MNCVNAQEVAEAFALLLDSTWWSSVVLVLVSAVLGWLICWAAIPTREDGR